ncbi:spinster family MFS transporter [Paraburkholderia pallida]|nr:MFS transporter [Paraburkholderia pallida]
MHEPAQKHAVKHPSGGDMNTSIEQAATQAARKVTMSRYCLVLLTVIYTLNIFDRTIVSVLLDAIKADLKLSDMQLGLIAGLGFAMMYALLGLPMGRLADRTRRGAVIAGGVFLWSIATLLGGFARSGAHLVAARALVGVGEAAGTAPSYSMLADYFPKSQRARVLSIFSMGLPIGIFSGVLAGGWLSQWYGWRTTLFLAGAPGLIAAALIMFTVPEPVPAEPRDTAQKAASLRETLRFLGGQRSYIFSLLGSFFCGFTLNALFIWMPSFLGRIHHLPRGQIGTSLAIALGLMGLIGVYAGGAVVTRFGSSDDRWKMWQPAAACALSCPFLLVMLMTPSVTVALVALAAGSLLCQSLLGPVFSVYQCVARPRMRSFATAVQNLVGTLGGLGVGSLLIGMLNDHLSATHGTEAIRYSLLLPVACLVPAALCYWTASRFINEDARRAA